MNELETSLRTQKHIELSGKAMLYWFFTWDMGRLALVSVNSRFFVKAVDLIRRSRSGNY